MKKMVKGAVSIVLCLCFVMSGISVWAVNDKSCKTMNETQWQDYFENDYLESTSIYLAPGSDDSEMNFSWLPTVYDLKPYVKISTNKDMSDAETFFGSCIVSKEVPLCNHVTVSGLEKGTTYYYQCSIGNKKTDIYSFTTIPDDNNFSAIYVTDIHTNYSEEDASVTIKTSRNLHNLLAAANQKSNISLIISGGDQADSGLLDEYIGVFASPYIKSTPLAMTIGNHDNKNIVYRYVANNPNPYTKAKVRSYNGDDYWYVKGDVLFLVMDSNNRSANDHYNFVKEACAQNPDVKWRVATFHHDLYGGYNENRENEAKWLRSIFTPIMDEFEIDLCMMGHSHYYSRTHVMFNNKIALNTSGKSVVTDAPGTIYFVSGSLNKPREAEGVVGKMVDYSYVSPTDIVYNVLDFTDDSLTIKSYILGKDEQPFETFSLEKTSADGGHKTDVKKPFWYPVVSYFSTIISVFNKIGNLYEYFTEHFFAK